MIMQYKLLERQKKGFILTREPEAIEKELFITFSGAPEGSTAIFENGEGAALYRLISDDMCSIPADFLRGTINVVVTMLNGKESTPKYACESIYTKAVSGTVVVCPNGLDIPSEIIEVCAQMQEICDEIAALKKKDNELDEKLKKLLDGYNII